MTSKSRSSSNADNAMHRAGLYDPAYEHDGCGIGFIAQIHGVRSHDIVRDALEMLGNLSHRSAVGCDPCTGDGAGILLQIPHAFLRSCTRQDGISLPELGEYGVGMLFLPADRDARGHCERVVESAIQAQGCRVLGWRDVPTDPSALGEIARGCCPTVRQVFVSPGGIALDVDDAMAFERMLFVVRKRIEREAPAGCYVSSLSSRTIIYKGMLRPAQVPLFYGDLTDERLASAIALVHSRFSTNTLPTWARAHPYRYICHNGEINTIRGNTDWMRVREEQMSSPRFGADVELLFPLIGADQSDSACLDNALELLVMSGRPLAHAMAMLIPESWEKDAAMTPARRAFYEYHAPLMEPWDGPAAVAFTDGRQIGAMLDRNGLRPARYVVTDDDRVVLASEAGALPIPPEQIRSKGRLEPGRMLVVNTTQGKVLDDEAVKAELVSLRPYNRLVAEHKVTLDATAGVGGRGPGTVPTDIALPNGDDAPLAVRQRLFGYTTEERRVILAPMGASGEEPAGSMGNDAPLAVLSRRPQLLYAYFKQLFAQVTNPAIDPIREQLVMSLRIPLGPKANLLDEMPEQGTQLWLDGPVLDANELAALRALDAPSLRSITLDARFSVREGSAGLSSSVNALCEQAATAARDGAGILVISDRTIDADWAPIPSLLALGAVHHHLIRQRLRSRVSLVVESGDARQVSHIALLIACGASAVHPYVALDTISELAARGDMLPLTDATDAQHNYVKAIDKGLLKILSKMGISTLQSYCGAQICETVGLDRAFVDRWFTGTAARLSGIGVEQIADETLARHAAAFAPDGTTTLDVGGDIHFRIQGEQHAWNPSSIATLQRATRTNDPKTFAEFSRIANDETQSGATLRGLLDFVERQPVPLGEVEPATEIVKRFVTGAMSFGSISAEAHETIAIAMNRLGGRSNTGEGGEDRARFGTDRSSAIKQVASARFGVTTEYLVNAAELQIKIAQGAKPGEGGQLPGHKVDAVIARTRHSTPGVTLISPPPHHDIYSIEDLAQLIHDLAHVNPEAAISVKLVAEAGVGTIAAGVAKAGADLITISGDSGGTGASPLSSIKNAGVPWELGLAEAQQTLVLNGLRGRVRLQTDGQLKTGRDVIIATLLGAEEFGFATAPLIVEGCVMMRKCHLNTCPVGIATQDPVLRAKFSGRPEHIVNYFFFVAEEVRSLLATLGARTLAEIVGRADLLRATTTPTGKAQALDLAPLLHLASPAWPGSFGASDARRCVERQDHGTKQSLDRQLLLLAAPALERGEVVTASMPVRTVDRAVGTMLSGEIARRFGATGLRDGAITLRFSGSAGQSFGAFGASGLTMELEGEANDYVGKGLSGARIIVRAPRKAQYLPDDAVIVGNTVLYGATSGEAYFGGVAGERFAVRNSGAFAVVEGVGDHGCEYMTGGAVVVLGRTGRNFAAGMSGGVAFVLDEEGQFARRCNSAQVQLEAVSDVEDRALLKRLVEQHGRFTGSARARHLLARWPAAIQRFVTVMPVEYKRARVEAARAAQAERPRYG